MAIAVAIGLRLLLYRTRLGVAMRAVVDDRSLAQLNGTRTSMVARSSWAIGTSLAALGGILIASSAGLSATVLSLLIVNAYGAAVFGRLRSLPMTFVGAVILGCLDGYLAGYLPSSGSVAAVRGRVAVGLAGDPAVRGAAGVAEQRGCAATCGRGSSSRRRRRRGC